MRQPCFFWLNLLACLLVSVIRYVETCFASHKRGPKYGTLDAFALKLTSKFTVLLPRVLETNSILIQTVSST